MPKTLIDQTGEDRLPLDGTTAAAWMQGVLAAIADPAERQTAWIKDAKGRDLTRIRAERVELSDGSHVVDFVFAFED